MSVGLPRLQRTITFCLIAKPDVMAGPPNKRQKREDYRKAQESVATGPDGGKIELPKKKFYRQRAHANPFSDHALT